MHLPTLSEAGKAEIEKVIDDAVQSGKVPGIVFGASNEEGDIIWAGAGYHDIDNPSSRRVDENSVFWVCSQTKLLTSLALLQLIEQQKLTLDTPVKSLIPSLRTAVVLQPPEEPRLPREEIRVKHLLNHTSGLFYEAHRDVSYGLGRPYCAEYGESSSKNDESEPRQQQEMWKTLRDLTGTKDFGVPLKFDPGQDFVYGYSSDVIGFIIERLSGLTLEEYLKAHIFSRVGMNSTSFYRTPDLASRSVRLLRRKGPDDQSLTSEISREAIMEFDPDKVNINFGGLGLHASMKDYLSLLRHLLRIHAGLPVVNPIVSQDTVKSLFVPSLSEEGAQSLNIWMSPHNLGDNLQWSNALCLNTLDWPGRRKKLSAFWFGWAGTYYFLDPTTGVAAVLGSQVIPTRDKEVIRLWIKLEETLYANLGK